MRRYQLTNGMYKRNEILVLTFSMHKRFNLKLAGNFLEKCTGDSENKSLYHVTYYIM
jgi:hypothetical protein